MRSSTPAVIVDLTRWRAADLGLVDVLARIALHAGRRGAQVVVVGAGPRLTALLELTGLAGTVTLAASECGGQAEPLEQARVEEVVDVGDPPVTDLEHLQGPGLVTGA